MLALFAVAALCDRNQQLMSADAFEKYLRFLVSRKVKVVMEQIRERVAEQDAMVRLLSTGNDGATPNTDVQAGQAKTKKQSVGAKARPAASQKRRMAPKEAGMVQKKTAGKKATSPGTSTKKIASPRTSARTRGTSTSRS